MKTERSLVDSASATPQVLTALELHRPKKKERKKEANPKTKQKKRQIIGRCMQKHGVLYVEIDL